MSERKQIYVKTPAGFLPVNEPARKFFDKKKIGAKVEMKGSEPRNLEHLNKFWSLMDWTAENAEGYDTGEQVCHVVKILIGHCDFVPKPGGGLEAVPKSISFGKMERPEFDRFYSSAIDAVLKLLPPGCDEETIMEALSYA